MGKYINSIGTTYTEKINNLLEKHDATVVAGNKFQKNLVCVVDNGHFAATGWAFDESEYKAFKQPDGRSKTWLVVQNVENLID